ncbi:GAF domain-containing protein [candidate division KSB1 bacterium]|nr:MAG: GAF domain-containing protein [candidate division KSB1 bacterium]
MNILNAHPKRSFIKTTSNTFCAQNGNHKISGKGSPDVVIEKGSAGPFAIGLIAEFVSLVHFGYSEPLNLFLFRILDALCQVFKFKRATLALIDFRRDVFVKLAMVGYPGQEGVSVRSAVAVPRRVVERIFHDQHRMKVLRSDQDPQYDKAEEHPAVPERGSGRRRRSAEWNKRDLLLLSLKDDNGRPYGYISLDEPWDGHMPTRVIWQNLELAARLVGMSIESYYQFSLLARKNRRLSHMLSNANIFKLHLGLTELLNEMVWSARHSLDFNLVTLALMSKKSQRLETKAVACDDKIKQKQLLALTFDMSEFSHLVRDDYLIGKSYLVNRKEPVLDHFKQIYYGADNRLNLDDGWSQNALILVPVRGRDEKTIGYFMADDPQEARLPTPDAVQMLEILADQIGVAIDNRIMYVQAKERLAKANADLVSRHNDVATQDESRDFKKIVEHFLR